MMYHLDGRRHRQSLVYFGEPQDLRLEQVCETVTICQRSRRGVAICMTFRVNNLLSRLVSGEGLLALHASL